MLAEHYTTTIGTIEITVAPPEQPPWNVDVIVEEQDTSLLLGGTHMIRDTEESYAALIGKMQNQTPHVPGQVIVRHTTPLRFIAIVYEIGRQSWYRQEWIVTALENIFHAMETYQAGNIALPLLGVTHGRLLSAEFMELLCPVLPAVRASHPEKIWLVTPMTEYRRIITFLEGRRT